MVPFPLVALAEIAKPVSRPVAVTPGESFRTIGVKWWGGGAYERETIDGARTAALSLSIVREGDLIINKIWVRHGSAAVATASVDGCAASGEFPTFRLDADRVLPRWIHWQTQSPAFWKDCDSLSRGTSGKNRIKPELFLTISVPLPSIAEQRRIVARLDALAAKIEEAKGLSAEAEARHDALFMSQIDRLFTPQAGWTTRSVEELCGDPQYGFTESASLDEVGPHFLRITDIQDGGVHWDAVPFCRCPNPTPYLLRPGDIVFARTGATTGKSFLIHDCPEAVFASYLIRLRVRDFASPEYLYWYFQTPSYWRQIATGSVGTGQANVNGTKLRALRVPVAPTSAQSELVAQVRHLQALTRAAKQTAAQALARINALIPSALDRAFAGGL